MFSTTNGCTCHMIQKPGERSFKCISCRGREKCLDNGNSCRECGVGIYFDEKENNNGLCSNCYYGDC